MSQRPPAESQLDLFSRMELEEFQSLLCQKLLPQLKKLAFDASEMAGPKTGAKHRARVAARVSQAYDAGIALMTEAYAAFPKHTVELDEQLVFTPARNLSHSELGFVIECQRRITENPALLDLREPGQASDRKHDR